MAAYGGVKRTQTVEKPSEFDNPVHQNEDFLGLEIPLSPAITEGRVAFRFKTISTSDASRLAALYEGSNTRVTLYRLHNGWGKRLYTYYPGPVDTNASLHLSTGIDAAYAESHIIEIYWKCDGASSIVKIYQNGILVIDHATCNIGTAGIDKILIGPFLTTNVMENQIEWVIVEDSNTEMCWQKFARVKPSGAGNTTGMTPKPSGSNYALVDETIADPADYCLADAADEKDTYACENCPSNVNTITALRVCGVVAQQAEGALKAKAVVRTGGSDYEGDAKTIGHVHTMFSHRWTQNPNTSSNWTTGNIDDMEIGAKAVSP
jgi:hypothetical protein